MAGRQNRRLLGLDREEAAAEYLRGQGYEVLARNYHCRFAELDIVARDGAYLCFVEVKYRESDRYEAPQGVVSIRKQGKICRGALFFMREHRILPDMPIRFDVVFIIGDKVTLCKNAFDYKG